MKTAKDAKNAKVWTEPSTDFADDADSSPTRTPPVSYMLPSNQAQKCPNFVITNWLFVILLSPLPHSPGYLANYPANHPEGNPADYSPSNPVRNSESYLGGYPASYGAGYLPENSASYSGNYRDSNSAGCSAYCPDNRRERNPEGNR
jgi:hypothetical protein